MTFPRLMWIPWAVMVAIGSNPQSVHAQENMDFKNTALPFDKRVTDLVKRFTLAEKAQQVQMAVPPNSRLGITGVNWWTEGLHGIARNGRATVFPQAIGMSAAWDPELIGKVGTATADESIVLLKNDPAPKGFGFDKVLPLDLRRISSIAVIGPYANMLQYGNYTGSPANPAPSPLAAIRAAVGERVIVRTADSFNTEDSIKAAALSDVAIVVVGLNQQVEFEGIDRSTLELPLNQRQLLEKVVKANPVTVVIMEGGGPIGCTWLNEHVPALMMAWYGGEQGGNAMAEILLGADESVGKAAGDVL